MLAHVATALLLVMSSAGRVNYDSNGSIAGSAHIHYHLACSQFRNMEDISLLMAFALGHMEVS